MNLNTEMKKRRVGIKNSKYLPERFFNVSLAWPLIALIDITDSFISLYHKTK